MLDARIRAWNKELKHARNRRKFDQRRRDHPDEDPHEISSASSADDKLLTGSRKSNKPFKDGKARISGGPRMVSGSRGSSRQQGSSRQAVVRQQETASKQGDSLSLARVSARARAQPLKKKASRQRANSDSFIHESKKTLDLSARSVTLRKSKEKLKVPEQEFKEESKKSPSKRHSDS